MTADTRTSSILNGGAWSGLVAGVVFGLITLATVGPAEAALRGTTFAVLMIPFYQLLFLVQRAKRRRERDR